MKAIALLILFSVSLYGADVTTTNTVGDITTKVSERTAKDGKPQVRVETVYRGIVETVCPISKPYVGRRRSQHAFWLFRGFQGNFVLAPGGPPYEQVEIPYRKSYEAQRCKKCGQIVFRP